MSTTTINNQYKEKRLKPILITGTIIFSIILTIGILGATGFFHKNPYGEQIKIPNFDRFFKNVPSDTRDSIFAALHNIALMNSTSPIKPTEEKAEIRSGSISNNYDQDTKITYSSFIVDITTLQQSYFVQFEWSLNNETNDSISGYPILVSCLQPTQEKRYLNFVCNDDITTPENVAKFFQQYPGLRQLPIIISEYSQDYSKYIQYNIEYKANEDYSDFTITINDYSGNNREEALKKLQELDIDTSKHIPIYNDLTAELDTPAKAPND